MGMNHFGYRAPKKVAAYFLLIALISGCASQNTGLDLGGDFLVKSDDNEGPDDTEFGVDIREKSINKVRVRFEDKSALSAIDELAYKSGFNYTLLSDISRFRVSITDSKQVPKIPADEAKSDPCANPNDCVPKAVQKRFNSSKEVVEEIVRQVNDVLALSPKPLSERLEASWVSDGLTLQLFRDGANGSADRKGICREDLLEKDVGECDKLTFKKMFFRNVPSDEAINVIGDLFISAVNIGCKSGKAVSHGRMTQKDAMGNPIPPAQESGCQGQSPGDPRAVVINNRAQNAVIIRGLDPNVYERIGQIYPAVDAEFRQVVVETQVFEYDVSIARRIGAALEYTKDNPGAANGTAQRLSISTQFGEGITSSLPTIFYQLSNTERRAMLLSKLALFDRDGLVRITAEPRLAMKSGEEAMVSLKTVKSYLTTGINSSGDVKAIDAGITFSVTPVVLGNNRVQLKISIVQSEFIPSNDAVVVTARNENVINTSVIANDGEAVSIGGIISKKDAKFSSGMSWMRKLPVVGTLFGSEAYDRTTTRVEFVIRPTVSAALKLNRLNMENLQTINKAISSSVGQDANVPKATNPPPTATQSQPERQPSSF